MPAHAPSQQPERSAVAQKIGPYRLIRPISSGGMARVYEARRDSLAGVSTRVAVKVIHPDYASEEAFQELFISEARISSALEHQNLVRIQDFNRDGELYYLVMEFIEGLTIRRVISLSRKHKVTIPLTIIAELGRQVCEGLDYAHRLTGETGEVLGLIHRDIKPSNVMLNPHGVVKVLDFGISAGVGQRASGGVQGTWGYMSLEQAEGRQVNAAADVFGLGAVLYELVKMEPLLDDKDNNRIRERLIQDEPARRAASLGGPYAELGSILVRALQRDPQARFQSAAEFGRALSQLIVNPVNVQDELKALYQDLRRRDAPTKEGAAGDRPISVPTIPSSTGRSGANITGVQPTGARPTRGTAGPRTAVRKKPSAAQWMIPGVVVGVCLALVVATGFWSLNEVRERRLIEEARGTPAPVATPAPTTVASPISIGPAVPVTAPTTSPPTLTSVPSTTPGTVPTITPSATSTTPGTPTTSTVPAVTTTPVTSTPVTTTPATSTPTTTPTVTPRPDAVPTRDPRTSEPTPRIPAATATKGFVSLGSDRLGASVFINGNYVAGTPIYRRELPVGPITVQWRSEGEASPPMALNVDPDAPLKVSWSFAKGKLEYQ